MDKENDRPERNNGIECNSWERNKRLSNGKSGGYIMIHWKDRYKGRCWIIGNGPGLDLSEVNGYSFATNRIAMLYDITPWRPTFFYAHTIPYNDDWRADVERSIALGIPCFLHERLKFLGDRDNIIWIPDETYHGLSGLVMAKIASYMGFTDLKFTGHDGNFKKCRGIDLIISI